MAFDGSLKFDTKIDTSGFKNGVSSLKRAAESFEKKIHKMGNQIDQSLGKSEKVTALENEISATEEKIRVLVSEMKEMEETKLPTKEYTELEKQVERAGKKLEGLLDRKEKFESIGRKTNTSAWKGLLYDIDLASKKYDALARKKEEMESDGTAYTSGSSSSSYQKKADSLAALNDKLYEQKKRLSEVEAAESAASQSGQEYVSLMDSIKLQVKAAGSSFKKFGKNVVIGLATSPVVGFTSAMKGAFWLTKRTGSAFKKVGFNAIKKSIAGAARALSKFNKALWSIGKNSNKSKSGFSMIGMLGKSLMFSMVFRSLSAISNALKEGMQNFTQYSGSFNSAMTSFTGSLTQLKNSFAAAFSPVTSIAIPALDVLIQKLIQAINVIGQFMSAMSGKNTFTRAVKVNDDYAASLKKTGGAARSAGKEAKKALAPFDDLVQIQQQSTDASGGGTAGTDPSQMFTEETIENGISGFANKLKELIDAEDWDGIGQMLGEKVNASVSRFADYVSWDNVGAETTAFLLAFTAIFNSMAGTIDWYSIGGALGSGADTLIHIMFILLTGLDWKLLGSAVALGLNGMVDSVDWNLFGRTLGAYFQAKISALYGFVSTADWPSIGQAIGDSLNGMTGQIDWEMLGLSFAAGLSGIFDIVANFAETYDWVSLGNSVSASFSSFFETFDWAGAGAALSLFVLGFLNFLITIVQETDWRAFGEGVADGIKAIDWTAIVNSLFTFIGLCFGGFAAFLGGLLADGVSSAKEYFQGKVDECGGNIVAGILKGILDGIIGIGLWIYKNVVAPIIDGFAAGFGFEGKSPSTVMAEMGQYLWDGFCNGIKAFFSSPGDFIKEHITDPFVDGVKNLLGIHSPSTVMEGIGSNTVAGFNQGVTDEQSASQNVIQTWAEGVAKWFSNKFGISNNSADESRKWAIGIMSGFNTTVNRQYTDSQSVMEKWAENVRQWFIGDSDTKGINEASWKKFAENIIQAFINAINIGHTGTKEPMEVWASHAQEWFWGDTDPSGTGGMYVAFYNMAKRINEGFSNGISDFAHMAKSAIREWANDIMDTAEKEFDIHSPSKEFRTIAEYVIKGFNEGILSFAASSQSVAQKWLDGIIHVFDGVDITIPVGLNIPNAAAYIPRMATGSIVPPRTGEASLEAVKRYGIGEQEEILSLLIQKIDELIAQIHDGDGRPIEIVLNLTGNLASLARILKPELDKEAARKGVNLVVVGGV